MNACSECLFLVSVWSRQLKLTVAAAVILTYSRVCGWTRVPGRPVSCLNGSCVIDLHLHQSTAAICERLCIKRPDEWAEKRGDVKKEHLCPLAYCFSTLSSSILANPRPVCYTGAVSPALTASLCGILCYFLGCVLSWLWTSRQEGPRLQMWAAPAAAVTEQHIVLGELGELGLQSEPDCRLSLQSKGPALTDLCAPSVSLPSLHHYDLDTHFKLLKGFRNVFIASRGVFVFSYLF